MGRHSTTIAAATITSSQPPFRKRKRDNSPRAEIEVDISAPEPPSKKALRKAKKAKAPPTATEPKAKAETTSVSPEPTLQGRPIELSAPPKRSECGIWIGNLPWTATKLDIRTFFTKDTSITDDIITRLHLPPPSKSAIATSRQKIKPQNQGFAYVDFSSKEALAEALALSEKLLTGRRVLIKDAKSFEGRPEKSQAENSFPVGSSKPPSKRIFVGNLGFDTTKELLQDHFARCGEILYIHIATFEDSGKCKGYAWVDFAELEAGEAAVRGWVNFEQGDDVEHEDDEIAEALADQVKPKKKPRLRKWWLNRLGGRPLRMEFAEGKDVRYKKRYGNEGSARKDGETVAETEPQPATESINGDSSSVRENTRDTKHKRPSAKVDARTIKPGAALAAAPRLTGSIVESQGRKTTFA